MATHPYPSSVHNSQHISDENYKYMQWGVSNTTDAIPIPSLYFQQQPYQTDYYPTQRQQDQQSVYYSQITALDTGFRKLKSNQIEVLRELKREYEVLRNTELDSGIFNHKKIPTDRSESVDDSSNGRSNGRSSSYSKAERTRRKSQNKDLQVAALEKKQMQLMLNNSMKKIQQLLSQQIDLKKNILQLKARLDSSEINSQQQQYQARRHRQQVQSLKRSLQESKKQIQAYKQKFNQKNTSLSTIQGEIAVCHLQLRKKDQRLHTFQQEIYLQKNKYCNLELELKKVKLESEMTERTLKEEIISLKKKLNSTQQLQVGYKNEEIRKLKKEIEIKDQRYRLLLEHKEQQNKNQPNSNRKDQQDLIEELKREIEILKTEKQQKNTHSDDVLASILQKLGDIPAKQDQQLLAEVHSLRQELEAIQNEERNSKEATLQQKIKELQKIISELEKHIEDQNIDKMYFIQDIKKIKGQMNEERRRKQEAEHDVRDLKSALRRVEEESKKYIYELESLKNRSMDLTQTQHQKKNLMKMSQQVELKDIELAELKEDHSKIIEQHKSLINNYESELKIANRKLAEEEIKAYKIKEQMQLKINLIKTDLSAEIGRLRGQIDRLKRVNAMQINERTSEKTHLESKLMQKTQQLQRVSNQLNAFVRQRDSILEAFRAQHEKKIQAIQEENTSKINTLVTKIESFAELSSRYSELMHNHAIITQDNLQMKRALKINRQMNDGINHLWSVKEAQYCNINEILKELQ